MANCPAGLRRRTLLSASLAALGAPLTTRAETVPRLGEIAARAGLAFGFALDAARLAEDPAYAAFVARQATIVVPENALKWANVHPEPGRYTFGAAHAIASFAARHRIALRGHTLCWHRDLPSWVAADPASGTARDRLVEHVRTVVGRYRGAIRSWDVVNEAIAVKDGLPGGLRDCFWYRALGPAYVGLAFREAHAADPAAVLCYNEYGLEPDGAAGMAKRRAVLDLLRGALSRGVPVGALGVQSHLRAGARPSFGPGLASFLREIRGLGLRVLITEIDVDDSALDPVSAQGTVAETYKSYLDLVLSTGTVSAVLNWGVWDRPHRTGATPAAALARTPLMFGPDGAVKPATWAVAHCLERARPPD